MNRIPLWATILVLSLAAVGTGFWIAASRRRYQNESQAARLLDEGKIQITYTKEQIDAIAAALKKA